MGLAKMETVGPAVVNIETTEYREWVECLQAMFEMPADQVFGEVKERERYLFQRAQRAAAEFKLPA